MVQAAGATGNSGLNIVERAVLAAASAPSGTPLYCTMRPEDGQGSARQLYLTKTANASPSL